ncbi:MAG: GNAT family N-acetyltransferase [Pikeienuella sp.]
MTSAVSPAAGRLFAAREATWPPAEVTEAGGWRLRRGAGGGRRVSAASRIGGAPADAGAIAAAAGAMRAWGQTPLFQLRGGEEALDEALAAEGYAIADPTLIFHAEAAALLDERSELMRVIRGDCRIAIIEEIWAAGGIGPGRFAVMDRAPEPRHYIISRLADRCAGVGFAAVDGDVAMVHAVETREAARRKGAARMLMAAAARFAVESGARWLALAVTEGNVAACSLYRSLGMETGARYHYRTMPD